MSKNLTRKGLAFGAMVALSATSFVALPAAADTTGPVTLEPNAGETFNSLQQTGITLQSEIDPNLVGVEEAAGLAFLVENPDAVSLTTVFDTAGSLARALSFTRDTAPTVASPFTGMGAGDRLGDLSTPRLSSNSISSSSKFIYMTGFADEEDGNPTFAEALDGSASAEVQVFDEIAVTVANAETFEITLPNSKVITASTTAAGNADKTAAASDIQTKFRADTDYDATYAVIAVAAGTGTTVDITITFQANGNQAPSVLKLNTVAQTLDTETDGKLGANEAGYNFGTTSAPNTLAISVGSFVRDNVTLYVTAWLDANGNGLIDTFEKSSDREKITLFAIQNVSATTTLSNELLTNNPTTDELKANIVLSNDINMEQVGNKIGAVFYKNGLPIDTANSSSDNVAPNTLSANGAAARIDVASYVTADEVLRSTAYNWVDDSPLGDNSGDTPALTVGNYAAIAVYIGSSSTDTDRFLGATSPVVSLSNGLVAGVVGAYVKGVSTADVKYTDGTADVTDTFSVRAATKSVTFTVQVTSDDTTAGTDGDTLDDDLKAANVEVRADFSATRLATGASVTVSGQADGTLKFTGDLITSRARTNSDGIATFTITTLNGANLDQIAIDVQALNASGAWVTESAGTDNTESPNATVTWNSTAVSAFAATNAAVSGDNIDLSFDVTDNFDQPISTTTQGALKVYMVAVVNGAESPSTFSRTVDVVAGNAKASVANFVTKGTPALVVRGYLYRSGYESATANALLSGQALKTITVYNHAEVSAVQVPATLNALVTYSDYRTGNSNISSAVLKDSDLVAANGTRTDAVVLNGFVANANGAGLAASQVVVSGTGLLFESAGIFAKDSITVYAATDGTYSINVWTQTANATGVAITSTSGGKSATTTLKSYLPAALNGDNLVFTWSLPSTIVKNTTYVVTAKLTDKWGNPVSTRTTTAATPVAGVTFTGAGSVQVNGVNTGVAANFDATGTATVFVRSVRDVAGPGSISATLGDANYIATSTGTAVGALTTALRTTNKTTTVWDETKFVNSLSQVVDIKDVAPASAGEVAIGSFNGRVAVRVEGLQGSRLSVKVGTRWYVVASVPTNRYVWSIPSRRGAVVKVAAYINGDLENTQTITVR